MLTRGRLGATRPDPKQPSEAEHVDLLSSMSEEVKQYLPETRTPNYCNLQCAARANSLLLAALRHRYNTSGKRQRDLTEDSKGSNRREET